MGRIIKRRSDNYNDQRRPGSFKSKILKYRRRISDNMAGIPHSVAKAILIGAVAVEALTIAMLLYLNLLPLKFLLVILLIMLAIDVGILALVLNKKHGVKRAYTGLILAMIIMIAFFPASFFLYSTGDALQKISSLREQWEDYYVIALKDGGYKDLADIKNQKVFAVSNSNKMNQEANERLVTTANVEISDETDIMSLAHRIEDEKGGLHNNLIFTSESYYDIQCEEIDDFRKNTEVIYTMQVKKRANKYSSKVNVTEDPFNIYITGLDNWGSIDKVARSDVNMIMTVNPQTRQILLTSIPRDAYVELHSFEQMDKLTHSGIYGVEETIETVQDWLDIEIDYYVKVNFSMLVRLIDAVGNIDVYSDEEFDSAISYYHYKKGWNNLHGKQALYFARERKSFEKGDAARIKNQQKVVEALIKKVTNSRVVLMNYNKILDAISDNMVTNFKQREIAALVRMQLRDMDNKWSIKKIDIKCTEDSLGTYSMGMGRPLYVNVPKEESVEEAKEAIHDVMYPAKAVEETQIVP